MTNSSSFFALRDEIVNFCEAVVPPGVAIGEFLVFEAHQVEGCRVHGVDVDRILQRMYALLKAHGDLIEHYGDLDLETSRKKLKQTGAIDPFTA